MPMKVDLQLDPLLHFYSKKADRPLKFFEISAADIPEPHKSLLAHDGDMTPTLEEYYSETIQLKILSKEMVSSVYFRKVLLLLSSTEKPVEFGAIRIFLERFPAQAQKLILDGRRPLGAVLQGEGIPHSSRPTSYFKLKGTADINSSLEILTPRMLYGRCNTIRRTDDLPLAEIVEILPDLTHKE